MRNSTLLRAARHWLASLALLAGTALAAPAPTPPSADTNTIQVVCIGDSLTLGAGLSNPDTQSYPARLQAILGPAWSVHNEGHLGVTCLSRSDQPLWQTGAIPSAMSKSPRIVLILLGTNDSRSNNWRQADAFISDYQDLATTFVNMHSHPKIWLCTPLPIHTRPPTDTAWDGRIRTEVIPSLRQVADKLALSVIDLYEPFRNRADLFADGVHPNAEGAAMMAAIIADKIRADGTQTP